MTITVLSAIGTVGFIGGVLLLLPTLARPTVPFGVRVPPEHIGAPVIRHAIGRYYQGVVLMMLVVAAATVAAAFVVPPEAVLTIAPFAVLAAWFVPFLAARRTVLEEKRTQGWFDGVRQVAVADTSMRTDPPRYPWLWAAPSILIALGTIVVGIVVYPTLPERVAIHFGTDGPDRFADTTPWSAFGLPAVQVLTTLLLLGLVTIGLRSKVDLSATAPQRSAGQYRRYATTMARLILLLAAGMNLTLLVVALMVWDVVPATTAWVAASMAPTLIASAVLIVAAIRSGQSGHRLATATPGGNDRQPPQDYADRDDDAHWIGGLIYRNRDDPALWVPKRFGGVGWTINFGRPAAWVVTAVVIGGTLGAVVWALIAGG